VHAPDTIQLQFGDGALAWRSVAGPMTVLSDRGVPGAIACTHIDADPAPSAPQLARREGRAWIDAGERGFVLAEHVGYNRLDAAGGAVAWSNDGRRVWLPRADADPRLDLEFGLGIGLVAALAARRVFCLHAAALRWRDGCIALAGASGAGKSTFARAIDDAGLATRLTDDILPVDDAARAWPAFPQLKLAPRQWWPAAGGALPLRGVAVLLRGGSPACLPLAPAAAMQALLAATAGARAFPEPVLGAHLAVCAGWVARVPVWQLAVADRPDDPQAAAREAFDCLQALP
jgi:hypothetical protein